MHFTPYISTFFIFAALVFSSCAYQPIRVPEYGLSEKSMEEVQADSIYKKDLAYVQKNDTDQDAIDKYISQAFYELEYIKYSIVDLNSAWLLDSLNPHVYMGFALHEMANGNTEKAIRYYKKYRELYEKTPIPRPKKIEEAPKNTHPIYVYGKLISLKKDNGHDGHWEINWPAIRVSGDDEKIDRYLKNSNVLPENERYVLKQNLYMNRKRPFYTVGEIRLQSVFDEESGIWKQVSKDSIFRFEYVERQGLYLNEEQKSLVTLGNTDVPDSSARVFLLKPYALLSDSLAIDSYTEKIIGSENLDSPTKLRFKPYQEKTFHNSMDKPQVRSGINRSLQEEKYDSMRVYLDIAEQYNKQYGSMPLNAQEYTLLFFLEEQISKDGSISKKTLKKMMEKWFITGSSDSLALLLAHRLNPHHLSRTMDKKFFARSQVSPLVNINMGNLKRYLGSYSSGFTIGMDCCYAYACAGMGIGPLIDESPGEVVYKNDIESIDE
ncbi:MAG TPA: hypothetical protein PLT31_07590, partial [Fibrobacteraceae bacterium]|nr:hypothetical protein [Fibrobacteraceae bacterium]